MRASVCIVGLILVSFANGASAFTETLTNGVNRDLSAFAGDAGGADGLNDFLIETPFAACSNISRFSHLNSSARAFPPGFSYAAMNYAEAVAQNYASTGPFCPSDGDLFYIRTAGASTGTTADDRFYKFRTISNVNGSVQVEYEWLGTGVPSPPNSAYTFTTYDLFGLFTDTSTGTPSAWSWNFGDSTSSTQQHPRHRYTSAGTRSVTLTASNAGGADATPASQMVAVSERPSTLVAQGGTFDFDSNAVADLQVVAGSGCGGGSSHLETRNGAGAEILSSDYRTISAGDIAGKTFGVTNFCTTIDYLDGFMVRTGAQNIYRAWVARNDAGGIRLEFALLQAGPPPPPVTSFTFSSYDLITQFDDTSTGAPSSWSWALGDGNLSSAQNPRHRYATAGSRNACLTASNIGGSGSQVCQNVVVNQVVSTTVAVGSSISLDGDGIADLEVQPSGGCSVTNRLAHLNGTGNSQLSKDYRDVVAADASGVTYSTGPFCVDIDYLNPFLVRTSTEAIYKAWTAGNDASGIRLEFAQLLAGTPPPVSDYVFTTFDLFASFTDSSAGGPTSWSWTFGDGIGTSTQQDPRYRYATAGTRSACLTASNVGGAGNNYCENVGVTQVASTTRAAGAFFDLNLDGQNDLGVTTAAGPCGAGPNALSLQSGASFALLAKDYRLIVPADANTVYSSQATFCVGVDYLTPFLLRLGNQDVYRAWTAGNDVNGIRLDFALLVPIRVFANGFEN